MEDTKSFSLPCIGYCVWEGQPKVSIMISGSFFSVSSKTARFIATDLLLWANRIDEMNEEEENEETQEPPERGNAELLESIIKGCKELNIQMETMFPHDAEQTPMPEEEALKLILGERSSLLELVRQVEQYHGIGTEPKEDQCD